MKASRFRDLAVAGIPPTGAIPRARRTSGGPTSPAPSPAHRCTSWCTFSSTSCESDRPSRWRIRSTGRVSCFTRRPQVPSSPVRWAAGIGRSTMCRPLASARFPTRRSRSKGSGRGMEATRRSPSCSAWRCSSPAPRCRYIPERIPGAS
ncbi:hypothetical protein KPATCC21470_6521 [Kitasatospora purpeofusca]